MECSTSRRAPASMISGSGWFAPTSRRAASSMGRIVADKPTRCGRGRAERTTSSSRRSMESARCAPRLSDETAWISSTMIVRTSDKARRPDADPSKMNSDSGVVTSTCGGCLSRSRRSFGDVSPVRTAVRTRGAARPDARASSAISAIGTSRFFWTSFDKALSGEM